DGVANIFSRVTGADRSEIMGRLGVLGNANLFFMNPNGILFGVNSSLDVTGSFVVTTANGIQFGEQGFFSATNPELPSPLLTIDPSVFLFNQIPTGTITNNSITPVSATSPAGFNVFGLHVPDGESLLLLGGDINITGGRLNAFGGRIELAGLAGIGAVGITTTDQGFAFSFAPDSVFADLSLNDARIAVRGGGRGDIVIHADEFTATNGGRLLGGIETTGNSGNILVNANRVNFSGVGLGGIGSGIFQEILANASGNTGDIVLNTRSLTVASGGLINTLIRAGGTGNAGDIRVAADTIEVVGLDATRRFESGIRSETTRGSTGNGGNVTISSRVLEVRDGANIVAITRNSGQGGNLQVTATERAELVGIAVNAQGQAISASGLFAATVRIGNAGRLQFEGRQLRIRDGAVISAATFGTGDAGDIRITADAIELVGLNATGQFASGIGGETNRGSTGNGGDVIISSRVLQVRDGATVSVSTRGTGQGGNLEVTATERAELVGTAVNAQGLVSVGGLFATTAGAGNAGSLQFEGGQLRIRDGASISAATSGAGDAGDIRVAADAIELVGSDISRQFPSGIGGETHRGSTGSGGDVTVSSRVLEIRDGAISVATFGSG
ncbi:MAG TPA: filamentous hemagglutinin N-terminal domain-containing protein, partial [Allocoleopsis sp.]